jgi:hypothetical protein
MNDLSTPLRRHRSIRRFQPTHALVHDDVYRAATPESIDTAHAQRELRGWQRYMSVPEIRAEIRALLQRQDFID